MTYTTTLQNGKLILPDDLLKVAGLARDESVRIESTPQGLVVQKATATVSVVEVERLFPDEWIFMTVTQTDENGMALGGTIIAHGDQEAVQKEAKRWILKNPKLPNYFFFSGAPATDVVI